MTRSVFERNHAQLNQIYHQERSFSSKIPIQTFDDIMNKTIEYLLNDIVMIAKLISPICACDKKKMKHYYLCKSLLMKANYSTTKYTTSLFYNYF